MNHITQMNLLEKKLKSYKDFVPLCSNDDLPKLMAEIQRTINRISTIRNMGVKNMMEEVVVYYETKQSKLNFKTI